MPFFSELIFQFQNNIHDLLIKTNIAFRQINSKKWLTYTRSLYLLKNKKLNMKTMGAFNKFFTAIFIIIPFFVLSQKEYFPTKIIWPMSDFSFDGIPWSNPEVWFPNLAGLILLYIYRFRESFNSKN